MSRSLSKGAVLFVLLVSSAATAVLSRELSKRSIPEASAAWRGRVPSTDGQALPEPSDLRQYTAGGHVIGFRPGGLVIASGSHALRVEFVDARAVAPIEVGAPSGPSEKPGRAAALGSVSYPGLWAGITATYERTGSAVVKSTFYIEAEGEKAADPADVIRLRYNVPVRLDGSGDLVMSFASGEMRETRPVAWQDIAGTRVVVEARYRLLGVREVGLEVGPRDTRYPLVIDPVLSWNTFLGGSNYDEGHGIALDSGGNAFVTGRSYATWGTPIRAFTPGGEYVTDAFVAKLGANGVLQWNTFLGGTDYDWGTGIGVDAEGYCYVIGGSSASWGDDPVREFNPGEYVGDAFVAKLGADGALLWNTFLGGLEDDEGMGIAVDASGSSYALGNSEDTWGSPVRPYTPGEYFPNDAFVAKLTTDGQLQWNTFLGGAYEDFGYGIAVDVSGNSYVTGESESSWGENIIDPFVGTGNDEDAFAAKVGPDGALLWNTFMGAAGGDDCGNAIAVDADGNAYAAGESDYGWGENPVRPYSEGGDDAFVIKFGTNGARLWHTFLGGAWFDEGNGIAVDANGRILVLGTSDETWGSPIRPHSGGGDAYVAKLDTDGSLQWNAFLGGSGGDVGSAIALDAGGSAYVIGSSDGTWGSPIRAFSPGGWINGDAFVAKIGLALARVDLNSDGQEDLLWRYHGGGAFQGLNVAWLMSQGGTLSPAPSGKDQTAAMGSSLLTGGTTSVVYQPSSAGGAPAAPHRTIPIKSVLTGGKAPVLKARQIMRQPTDRGRGFDKLDRLRGREKAVNNRPIRKDALDITGLGSGGVKITSLTLGTEVVFSQVLDTSWEIAGTGDFNSDGKTDILWRYYGGGAFQGLNDIWFMDGTTFVSEAVFSQVADTNWRIAGTGDFNGDGETDILWRYYGTGAYQGLNVIWYMNDATFIGENVFSQVLDTNWRIEGTGDFNGDGETDILWRYYGTASYQGLNDIWFMNDSTFVGESVFSQILDTAWEIAGTGDFDGDSDTDVLWRYYGTGPYQGLNVIWYMNGATFSSEEVFSAVLDTNWRIVNR